jgi:hypothetical protein
MAFAILVELLNMKLRKKNRPVQLRNNLDYNADEKIPDRVVKKKKK